MVEGKQQLVFNLRKYFKVIQVFDYNSNTVFVFQNISSTQYCTGTLFYLLMIFWVIVQIPTYGFLGHSTNTKTEQTITQK